jgi:hypothetical protein
VSWPYLRKADGQRDARIRACQGCMASSVRSGSMAARGSPSATAFFISVKFLDTAICQKSWQAGQPSTRPASHLEEQIVRVPDEAGILEPRDPDGDVGDVETANLHDTAHVVSSRMTCNDSRHMVVQSNYADCDEQMDGRRTTLVATRPSVSKRHPHSAHSNLKVGCGTVTCEYVEITVDWHHERLRGFCACRCAGMEAREHR